MTVPVTRANHTPQELRDLAKRCGNGAQARRLRAIALIMEGHSRQDAAEAQNMDRQTLRDWVHRYNEFGPEGLNDRPKSGRKVFLNESQLKVISDWLEKGPDPETDGLVRWRVQDVKNKIQTNFGVKYSMEGTRRLMRRLGFRHVSPRPLHPKAKPKDQEKFRENFQDIVKDAVGSDKAGRTIEIWFQDEGRIGQKGMLARLWARKNSRPRVACDHRYGYVYLFGAACAERMLAVGHIADRANTASMNEHLALISGSVQPGNHCVLVLDGAGWHKSKELEIPENITLLILPPYSPELNPMENVIQYLKQNRFANRVFKDVAEVREACRKGWDWLCDSPTEIASIVNRDWATTTPTKQVIK